MEEENEPWESSLFAIKEGSQEDSEPSNKRPRSVRGPSVFFQFFRRPTVVEEPKKILGNREVQVMVTEENGNGTDIPPGLDEVPHEQDLNGTRNQREIPIDESDYRVPILKSLTFEALNRFKLELLVSEELRIELNTERDYEIPRPTPKQLVSRKLWGHLLVEFQKTSPDIKSFEDASFDDLGNWLIRTVVPQPNNRSFLKRIALDLKNAWAKSYFYGLTSSGNNQHTVFCLPIPSTSWNQDDNERPVEARLEELLSKPEKKLSTTSSVSAKSSSTSSQSSLS